MICKKCGAEIPEDSEYCNKCGTTLKEEPVPAPAQPVKTPGSTLILVLGILSVALNAVFSASVGGIVCGILCRIKVREYLEAGYPLTGKVSAGRTLGQVGLIVSIVSCALSIIAVIIFIMFYFSLFAVILTVLKDMPVILN